MSQKIKISELIPHKDNDFFFDDIQGEAWQAFVESIETSGVVEPIVITQGKVIVSGHQRVRACKALDIDEINAEVRIFDSDDEVLKCLIETNIRQRGIGNTNPVKLGRCLKELDRIYGVFRGNHTGENPNNSDSKTQGQIAEEMGISVDTYRNYERLAETIPEIQTLVETGIVTPTTARAIVKQLPEFQQKELAEQLSGSEKKVSQREVQRYIDMIAEKDRKIKELENREPEVKTVVKEVVPKDFQNKLNETEQLSERRYRDMKEAQKRAETAEAKLREIENTQADIDKKAVKEAEYFEVAAYDFIKRCGGYVWLCERINDMPDDVAKKFRRALFQIDAMTKTMIEQTGGYAINEGINE